MRQLQEKVKEYKEEKLAEFSKTKENSIRSLRKELIMLIRDLEESELRVVKETITGWIKERKERKVKK